MAPGYIFETGLNIAKWLFITGEFVGAGVVIGVVTGVVVVGGTTLAVIVTGEEVGDGIGAEKTIGRVKFTLVKFASGTGLVRVLVFCRLVVVSIEPDKNGLIVCDGENILVVLFC